MTGKDETLNGERIATEDGTPPLLRLLMQTVDDPKIFGMRFVKDRKTFRREFNLIAKTGGLAERIAGSPGRLI